MKKRRSLMSDFHLSQHNPVIPQMPPASAGVEKSGFGLILIICMYHIHFMFLYF